MHEGEYNGQSDNNCARLLFAAVHSSKATVDGGTDPRTKIR